MSGLGERFPEFQAAGHKVAPRDIDQYQQVIFHNLGTGHAWFGTVTSATANAAFVFDNILPDYPRNVLFSILGVAGGMGGTAVVNGIDRWGNSVQETISIGSAAGGGSAAGTRIYARLTSATLSGIDGLGGTAVGTARLGYAIGTSAALKHWIGLPTKIAGTGDVKNIGFVRNFVPTTMNGGTLTTDMISTTYHAVSGTEIVGSAYTYVVEFKPTYDNVGNGNLANR